MNKNETIIAPVTGACKSGVGIIRISGPHVLKISKKFFRISLKNRYAHYLPFLDENDCVLDMGIVILFRSPKSFTGEDVLEFQGHGNPVLMNLIIRKILLMKNIRFARPGEFSERAFLNGKLDLVQAESICDLINATSELSIQASMRSLQGFFSLLVNKVSKKIRFILVYLESLINFPEDVKDPNSFETINHHLKKIIHLLQSTKNLAIQGSVLGKSIKIVLAGPPNVGKSQIFNLLVCKNSSIVTNIPGTTRDVVKEYINIDGFTFEILDTAGIRRSNDFIEKIGIKRTYEELYLCDHIFLVFDVKYSESKIYKTVQKFSSFLKKTQILMIIVNKIDLTNEEPVQDFVTINTQIYPRFFISAKKKIGIENIINYLKKIFLNLENESCVFLARQRHIDLLKKSLEVLEISLKDWDFLKSIECLLENLYCAENYVLQILGKSSRSDVLDKIFSDFCIGK